MTDTHGDSAKDAVRADVWLWRARFFKTRSLAAKFVDEGRIRLTRSGAESRVDKPSRTVKPGDLLLFGMAGRLISIRVLDCGERRGPATEARGLYEAVEG